MNHDAWSIALGFASIGLSVASILVAFTALGLALTSARRRRRDK